MAKERVVGFCFGCGLSLLVCTLVVCTGLLVWAYYDIDPVEVTVEEASLERLALANPAGHGTPPSIAYNLSLAVAVRNPNPAIWVWRTAPLDAELRLGAGRPFAAVRLAGAEEQKLIDPRSSAVYRAAAAAESAPVALRSDEQAEFAWESALGLFWLEVVVSGEVHYEMHPRQRSFTVRCALRLPLSTAPAAVAFARLEGTLPPQACAYV